MPDIRQTQVEIRTPRSVTPYYFCTYFDRNYLIRGLALYNSLQRYCKRPFVLWVLCFDDETYEVLSRLHLPGIRLISLQEFEADDKELPRVKATRSRVEYYWTCTPSLPLFVFRHNPEIDIITYLDADLYFYSDPQPIFDEFENGSVLIIEHRFPPELGHLEKFGKYNVGMLIFRRDKRGLAILNQWRSQCIDWCYARLEDGKFADQKYLDSWPKRYQGVVILQHKGGGLAPWNYSRYNVHKCDELILVDSDPLIFYHFHRLKVVTNYMFDTGLEMYNVQYDDILIKEIYAPYLRELQKLMRKFMPLSNMEMRKLARQLLYRRTLLVLGPIVTEIHLEPMIRPLLLLQRSSLLRL